MMPVSTLVLLMTTLSSGATPIDPKGLTGAYFDPASSGQGFNVQFIDNGRFLAFFYGFKDNGERLWLVSDLSGTIAFGEPITATAIEALGGAFGNFDPAVISRPEWGTMTFTFLSCDSATASLDGTDGSQELDLVRLAGVQGLDCTAEIQTIEPATSWQWQLTEEIDTTLDVDLYDIDLENAPQSKIDTLKLDGRIVICYFSAGSFEDFRPDAADFPASVLGNPLGGFPDERWLDIRQIDALSPVLLARMDKAVTKGCHGVEPDNVDGYVNDTGFPLTAEDQLLFNTWLADQAHRRGLSVGLKNDLDQIPQLVPFFDWALNEQCFEFDECEAMLPFIEAGKAVFGVEYNLQPEEFCDQANALNYDWLSKNLDLDVFRISCR